MDKGQMPGMQCLTLHACGFDATVNGIRQQGMPDMGHVDPDLMGAASAAKTLSWVASLRRPIPVSPTPA